MLTLPWLRYLGWARSALAGIAMALSFLYPVPNATIFRTLSGVFFVYTLLAALRGRAPKGLPGLAALAADTAFFLALASLGSAWSLWTASAFFLCLLTGALALYTPVEVFAVAGVCAILCGLLPFEPMRAVLPTVVVGGTLGCGFAVAGQRQKRSFGELSQQVAEAQKRAEEVREEERQRIASDFHDGPLQSFIGLQMRLEILRKVIDRDLNAGLEDLRELQRLAQTQVRDLRTFLHSMRPVDVDGANFVGTARRMAESFQKESGIPVTFLGTNSPVGLPQETTTEALQMLREALHNVQKHAGATRVAVSLEKYDRGIEIAVDDNGHGFAFAGNYTLEELELLRLGPASLKRRARALNAELSLESRPGRGAGLKFRIPLQ